MIKYIIELRKKYLETELELTQSLGRIVSIKEVANKMGINESELSTIFITNKIVSLDAIDEKNKDINVQTNENSIDKLSILEAIDMLNEQQKEIDDLKEENEQLRQQVQNAKEIAVKNAEDIETIAANKEAYKNDTIEAAEAIAAHEPKFKAILDKGGYDLTKELTENQIDTLGAEVDKYRSGKLTTDRIQRMEDIRQKKDIVEELGKKDKTPEEIKATMNRQAELNKDLGKAYDAFRELNSRIEASRQLKFNIASAQARIEARGGKL